MVAFFALALLQATPQQAKPPAPYLPASVVRDSVPADSAKYVRRTRKPVTAHVLATAFKDQPAGELYYRARAARKAQDSALVSYVAESRERVSIGMHIGEHGRERIMYRHENVARVSWHRDIGVNVEITGARMATPVVPAEWKSEMQGDLAYGTHASIPYFPGHEAISFGAAPVARDDVNDRAMVHPFAEGSEAYYTYESGDSIRYTLPDRSTVQLREIRVRPRTSDWNLLVGSLMFDISSGQLVRAALRQVAPTDGWAIVERDVRENGKNPGFGMALGKATINTFESIVTEATITYSLHQGRFWLPRSRVIRGVQQMAFLRAPLMREQTFTYSSVNGDEPPPQIVVINQPDLGPFPIPPDSLDRKAAAKWRDSVWSWRDTVQRKFRDSLFKTACDSTGKRLVSGMRADGRMPVAITFDCDLDKLAASPEFVGSLFDPNEAVFGTGDRDEVISRALSLAQQAPLFEGLPLPKFSYGLALTRYNRVEGFSTGAAIEQQLGGGYVANLGARFGFADAEPQGALSLVRSNHTRTWTIGAYHRLSSANDWGNPLSFGAGVSALLFGRDEGFYYRGTGAELGYRRAATGSSVRFDWKLFAERQRTAVPEATWSLGPDFMPNIAAAEGWYSGSALRLSHTHGLDPHGFRTTLDLRAEAASGDSTFGRGAFDFTVSRGLGTTVTTALTLAAGSSVGGLPMQRYWFLGGTHTVRGQRPDPARSGSAFWMSRFEIGRDFPVVRPTLFGDVGWAGDRTKIADLVRPMSGAGIGLSVIDGLLRLDVARGIYPDRKIRIDMYLAARF